jgi:hypothetical protein
VPFPSEIRDAVRAYCRNDLPGDPDHLQWHIDFFDFLDDEPALQARVGEEFFTARYIYKFFEGMLVGAATQEEWAARAQVQIQVQQYASIYEACLHHLLFVRCRDERAVQELLEQPAFKQWDVSEHLREKVAALLAQAPTGDHPKELVAAYWDTRTVDERLVRFDDKARAAVRLAIIDEPLANELIDFYEARNLIHIHAELRKGATWQWQLNLARAAYRRLQPFRDQVRAWLNS